MPKHGFISRISFGIRRAEFFLRNGARLLFLLCVTLGATMVAAVEHPGSIGKDADCASCHGDKMKGASVHSVMASACTVCHITWTRGDMTTVTLSMPKDKICYSCHAQAAETQLHREPVRGQCMDCHDAHASDRRMLLRETAAAAPMSGLRKK